MTAFAYLLAIPLAIWTLAAVYGLIDRQESAVALRALCVRILAIGGYVLVFGPAGQLPLLVAFAVVGSAHLATAKLGRWLMLSRKFYTDTVD